MRRFFVGTSGFSYAGWRGLFYPPELPASQFLSFYARQFSAVELNVTFYRWPRPQTLQRWREAVGEGFRFVAKVHRQISHQKRLVDCEKELRQLAELCRHLQPSLLLLQLPPSLPFDPQRLEGFCQALPADLPPLVWEARHRSFFTEQALSFFRQAGLSLVVADSGGRYPCVRTPTAPPLYLRFHGPGALYASRYTDEQLAEAASWALSVLPEEGELYAFFNNDVGGHAIANARLFAQLLTTPGLAGGPASS